MRKIRRCLPGPLFVFAALFVQAQPPAPAQQANLDQGYFDMYDLNFPGAHAVFTAWIEEHPQDPLGPASDAAAYLFSEFDRLGVLDIELFADEDKFTGRGHSAADANLHKAFDDRLDQAGQLADAELARNPGDSRALYTKTLIAGLRSDYAAMIDKKDYAALKYTEQASAYAKRTLAADPTLYDASIAVGVENYMLSLKPGVLRFFLLLRGDSTSREEGVRQMTIVAEKGHYLAPFARLMLAVVNLKEHHPEQARSILSGLAKEFPQNTLYTRQLARIK
jgi:hypothetical protein